MSHNRKAIQRSFDNIRKNFKAYDEYIYAEQMILFQRIKKNRTGTMNTGKSRNDRL